MVGKIRYAYLDDLAVVFDDTDAYEHRAAGWVKIHIADAVSKARLITRAEFDRMFADDNLGELPIAA